MGSNPILGTEKTADFPRSFFYDPAAGSEKGNFLLAGIGNAPIS